MQISRYPREFLMRDQPQHLLNLFKMHNELKDKVCYNWDLKKQNKNIHTSQRHASLLNNENHLLIDVCDVLPTSGCLGPLL